LSKKIEQQIRKYFKDKYNIDLTDEDYLEVSQSLYHLGKAIYRSLYLNQKDNVESSKDGHSKSKRVNR
jgi:hypothetical protein